jgi:integrase/recombinase XerD
VRPARVGGDHARAAELDLEAGVLRARGKGSKERIVPIGSKAIDLERCAPTSTRAPALSLVGIRDEPHVFVNLRGAGLSRQGLYKIVQRHARTAPASRTG